MRLPILMFTIVLLAGCTAPRTAPEQATVAAAKPIAQPTPTVGSATTEKKPRAPAGYKVKTRDGQTLYCKTATRVGTRFETETCLTASEAAQMERQAEVDRQTLRKTQGACSGVGCGGG